MDKMKAKMMAADIAAALEAVAKKHGMTVELKGGSYDPTLGTYRPKVEFKSNDSDRVEFERYAQMFGMKKEAFGHVFTDVRGNSYKVVGIRPSASKRPVLATSMTDGKTYCFPGYVVVRSNPELAFSYGEVHNG